MQTFKGPSACGLFPRQVCAAGTSRSRLCTCQKFGFWKLDAGRRPLVALYAECYPSIKLIRLAGSWSAMRPLAHSALSWCCVGKTIDVVERYTDGRHECKQSTQNGEAGVVRETQALGISGKGFFARVASLLPNTKLNERARKLLAEGESLCSHINYMFFEHSRMTSQLHPRTITRNNHILKVILRLIIRDK